MTEGTWSTNCLAKRLAMYSMPIRAPIHNTKRKTRLGLGALESLRGRVTRGGGKPGDGGGEKTKWLKLKRDDVDEVGTLSF